METIGLIDIFNVDPIWIWRGVKLVYMMGLLMYLVFALVVVRQVEMMINSLDGMLVLPVRWMARIHLIVTCGLIVLALMVL